mmetsp:Transcript_31223/g.38570  ORF Transcript_31223/g.38570 Transcript_31223/m.38570 type:complete len:135 (-) Transcript_31223:749-1153(-)
MLCYWLKVYFVIGAIFYSRCLPCLKEKKPILIWFSMMAQQVDSETSVIVGANQMPFRSELVLPFSSEKHAKIAMNSLEVDKELRPDAVKKTFRIKGDCLLVTIHARDAKTLRTSISSFSDYASVVVRTLREFGE